MAAPGSAQELSPVGVAMVVGLFLGAALIGYAVAGVPGGFAGALGSAFVSAATYGISRVRQADRSLPETPLPDLDALAPQQRMSVMTAMLGAGTSSAFRSDLLARLDEAETSADTDPEGALAAVEALREEHPRNPAVHAALARRKFALGHDSDAVASWGDALGCALDGGMNPMAARLFAEFADHRDALSLEGRQYPQLARVLRSRGEDEAADWCDTRTDP